MNLFIIIVVACVFVFLIAPSIMQFLEDMKPRYIKKKKKFLFMNNDGDDPCKQKHKIEILYRYIDNESKGLFEV